MISRQHRRFYKMAPKRVLLVSTSAGSMGGKATGLWISELAEPYPPRRRSRFSFPAVVASTEYPRHRRGVAASPRDFPAGTTRARKPAST